MFHHRFRTRRSSRSNSSKFSGYSKLRRSAQRKIDAALKVLIERLESRTLLSLAAGSPDPTFNLTGTAITDVSGQDQANALVVDPQSGDMVVAGSSNSQSKFAVALYGSGGQLFQSVSSGVGGAGVAQADAAVLDGNGNVLVAGYAANAGSGDDFVLARYNLNTLTNTISLDTGFGTNGFVVTDINGAGENDIANAIALQPTGGGNYNIIVAGETGVGSIGGSHAVVARYTQSGLLDSSFGNGGALVSSSKDVANSVAVNAGGIALAGETTGNSPKAEVLTTNSAGSNPLAQHILSLGTSPLLSSITSIYGGEFLVAGTADNSFVLAKVTAGGALDGGFGTGGEVETSIGSAASASAIAVQNNGKIVLAGSETDTGTGNDYLAVARYDAGGTLDPAFGTGGVVTNDLGSSSSNSVASAAAIEADGKIVVAGTTEAGANPDNFAVARFVADNAPTAANSTATFDTIIQNNQNNPGNTVANLVSQLGVSDVDGDSLGVAVTAVDDTNGTWQYSTDSGANWQAIPAVSDSSAFLLADSAANLIRFAPNLGYNGGSSISLRAWDQTQGVNGGTFSAALSAADNLNAFSDANYSANITVSPAAAVVYVNASWVGTAPDSPVTDGFGTHTFGIDAFATIQDGADFVASGGIVHVDAGTYAENVVIANTGISILGPNTSYNPNSDLSPANPQAIVEPGSGSDADASSVFLVEANNVTIEGLTIQGSNSNLTGGFVLPTGVTVYAGAGISNAANVANAVNSNLSSVTDISGLTVGNNLVKDFKWIGIYGDTSDDAPSGNNTISDNFVTDVNEGSPAYAGEGILAYDNFYADITDNVMTSVRTGIQVGNFSQANPGADPAQISGNSVDAFFRGIYDNLQYDTATGFNVTGNTIRFDSADLPAGYDLPQHLTPTNQVSVYNVGLLVQSLQPSVSATIQNNDVSGFIYGAELWNLPTGNTITLQGGTLSGNQYGVYVTNNDPRFGAASPESVIISGVTIENSSVAGVFIQDGLSTTAVGATITGDTSISGGGIGILVSGPDATLAFADPPSASLSSLGGNYITLTDGAEFGQTIDASTVSFDGLGGLNAGTTLDQFYGIEDKVTDYLDDPTVGYVRIKSGNVYVAHSSETANAGAIQRGVNAAVTNDTVHVQAGRFIGANVADATDGVVAAVQIDKSISLIGANPAFDPTGPAPVSQTILLPGSSDPSLDVNESVGVEVIASNVTVQGITFDGSNPNLTHNGGVVLGGTPIDAAEGVVSYRGVGGITITNNIIEHTDYTGVDFYNADNHGAATSDNTLSSNLIQNLSDAVDGIGVLIYNNFYAQIDGNVINNVNVGVQTGNFSNANPDNAFLPEISNNQISARGVGIFYNLMYDATSSFTVGGNHITAIHSSADAPWDGILLTSIQSNVGVTFQDNVIDGSAAYTSLADPSTGINVWNTPTTGSVTLTGDTISGVDYGIWLNSYEAYQSPADTTHATINGENITANKIGIYVEDSALNTSHPAVSATIEGGTQITAGSPSAVGLQISGTNASVTSNTINNTAFTGFTGNFITLTNGAYSGLTPGVLDATGATFNSFAAGATTPSPANLSSFYGVEDQITDYLDDPSVGYVQIKSGYEFVTQLSENTTHSAIQRAINVANPGDIVDVNAGTYTDTSNGDTVVNIDKSVTVQGTSGSALTTIDGNSADSNYYIVIISVGNVTFSGFTVTNPLYDGSADASGVLVESPAGGGAISNINIEGDSIHDVGTLTRDPATYGTTGVNIEGQYHSVTNVTVENDTIYNLGNIDPDYFAIGVLASGNPGSPVEGVTIEGDSIYDISNPTLAAAVDAGYGSGDVLIDGNSLGVGDTTPGNIGVGIHDSYYAVGEVTITNNTIANASQDGLLLNSTLAQTVTHNTLASDTIGMEVGAGATLTSATGNLFTGNSTAILIDDGAASVGPITGNSLDTTNTIGLENDSTMTVNATNNWWGSVNGPTGAVNTFNVGHQGSGVIGAVNVAPWLTSGHNNATVGEPGFYPDASISFSPVTNSENDGFSSIQAGIDGSPSGDTLTAVAGTFTENITIDKPMTITGAGQGSTIIYPADSAPLTGGSIGGSVVALVQANNVTIENLTINGDNPNLTSGVVVGGADIDARTGIITDYNSGDFTGLNVNHITVENIYLRGIEAVFDNVGGESFDIENNIVSNVQGDPDSVAIFNYGESGTIGYNQVSSANDAISANHSTGTEFIGNVITDSGSGIHTDNSGDSGFTPGFTHDVISGNTVSDGTPGSYGIFVFAPYAADSVSDNNISGVSVGLAEFGSGTGPTPTISFDGNSVDGTGVANSVGAYVTTSLLGFGSADASASFTNNTFTNNTTGVYVEHDALAAPDIQPSVSINGGSISGSTTGIDVQGGSVSVSNVDFDGTPNTTDLLAESGAGTVTASGNSFFATGNYIINQSPNYIDASDNTFNGYTPSAAPADLNSQFALADKIVDAVDVSGYGLVDIDPTHLNIYVTPNSFYAPGGTTTPSVQRGVDAASAADTVQIENGPAYVGQVLITKNLTLKGQSENGVTLQANNTLSSAFSTGSGNKNPVVYANDATVTVENLTVDGDNQGNAYGDGFLGIAFYNAGGAISGVTITNVENNPLDGDQNGNALYVYNADSAIRSISITGNTINNYQKNGMSLFGSNLTVDVENNVVTGAGNTTEIAQNGIEAALGVTGTISGNTVSGNEYSGSQGGANQFTDVQSTGILLFSAANLIVSNNIIDGNDIGIYNDTDNATISGNQLGNTTANRYEGIVEDQGSSSISGNTIKGGNIGIDVVTFDGETVEASSAILDGNTVSGAGVGIEAIVQTPGDPAVKVLAQNNTLSGNNEGVVISGGATVDLGTDPTDSAHLDFSGLGTSTGHNILTGYTGAPSNYAIDDQNTPQGTEPDVLAEDNNFGPYPAGDPGAIGQVIHDHNDNSSLTTVYFIPALNEQPAPFTVYVNSAWAGSTFGSDPGSLGAGHSFGYDEFSDIQSAIDAVASGGVVNVAAGVYADPTITKSLTLNGAQAGNSAAARVVTAGYEAHESIITSSSPDSGNASSDLLNVEASNVTINGFDLDGSYAHGGAHNGIATVDAGNHGEAVNNLIVEDNIVQNVGHDGIALINPSNGSAVTSGGDVTGNVVRDFGDYGVLLAYNAFADVTSNTIVMPNNAEAGVWVYDFTANGATTAEKTVNVSSNNVTAGHDDYGGIWANLDTAPGATLNISNNTVNAGAGVTGADGLTNGIYLTSIENGFGVSVTGNTVGSSGGQFATGISLWNLPTDNTVTVSGGSVGNSVVGIEVDNDDINFGPGDSTAVNISGVSISGAGTGILVSGDNAGGGSVSADITGANIISGGSTGIEVTGPNASATITGNTISDNGFSIEITDSLASDDISNNQITDTGDNKDVGLVLISIDDSTGATISGNTINGADIGVYAWNDSAPITVSGGTIENAHDSVNNGQGVLLINDNFGLLPGGPLSLVNESVTLDGVALSGNDTAISVDDYAGAEHEGPAGGVAIGLTDGTSITGGNTGLIVDGPNASVIGDTLNNTTFSGQSDTYIQLADHAMNSGGTPTQIDATGVEFEGSLVTAANLSAAYTVEDKIGDYLDDPTLGYVELNATNVFVTQASETSTAGAIQRGINVAPADGTVNVQAGTFNGDLSIGESLTLSGAQAGVDPGATGRGMVPESIITGSGVTGPVTISSGVNDVTIDGFIIQSPNTGSGGNYAAIYMNGSTGVTIDYNIIQDNTAGIAIAGSGGAITNNLIRDNNVGLGVQPSAGAGIEFFAGSSGTWSISNNHFTNNQNNDILSDPGTGATVSGLTISGNHMTASGGIALLSTIGTMIENNVILNNLYGAIALIGGNNGVTISGNTITDPNGPGIDIIGDLYGAAYPLFPAGGPDLNISISDNQITGATGAGIELSSGDVAIDGNTLTGDGVGVETAAFNYGGPTYSGTINATLDGNIITGDSVAGIEAADLYNSFSSSTTQTNLLAQNNNLTGDGEGVVISGGATVDLGYDSSDHMAGHSDFTGLGSSTGHNTLTGYTGAPDNYAIDDQNTPPYDEPHFEPDVLAEDNNFGPYSANDAQAIGQVINDHHDNSSLTTVFFIPALNELPAPATVYVNNAWAGSTFGSDPDHLGAGHSFGYDEFSDIQSGIDAVASGGTVIISNGTYDPSNILIPRSMTIEGASEAGVIITPSLTDSHDDSSFGGAVSSNGFIIAASNVTIEDLTLNGGASQDFRDGIITNSLNDGHTYNNLTVQFVTVDNANRKGIAIYNYTGLATGIVIEHDTLNNIGTTSESYEGTAAIAVFGSNATIENNAITNSAGGIEGNSFDGTAIGLTVSDNNISSPSTTNHADGALGIDVASLAGGSTISDNIVNLTGGDGNDIGIVVSYDQGAVSVDGNTITAIAGDEGILLYQDSAAVTVSGNGISGTSDTGTGILVTAQGSDLTRFGATAAPVSADITGNTISGFTDGVAVVSDDQTGDTASANIGDGTAGGSNTISDNSVGILITGGLASADINDNSITDSATAGIQDNGADATISNIEISGGGDGIDANSYLGSDGVLTITANTISGGSGHGMNLQDLGDGSVIGGALVADGNSVIIGGGGTGIQTGFAKGSLTIENNGVTATGSGAIGIDAVATGGALTIDDNTVSGSAVSIDVNQSQGSTEVDGNIVTNSNDGDGIVIFNTATSADVSGNTLSSSSSAPSTDDAAGIEITSAGTGVSQADVTDNAISGFYTGVQVDASFGGTASAAISDNHIYGNTTGVKFTGGGSGSVSGNNLAGATSNGTDLQINSTAGAITIGDGNAFAASGNTIDNQSSQGFDLSGYTTTTFGGFNAATTAVTGGNLSTFYGVEDKIVDYLDLPASGYVRIKSGYDFVTQLSETTTAGAISRGINVAELGDIVDVKAGSFSDNLTISQKITLSGAGDGSSPASNTIITSAAGNTPVISLGASGASSADRLTIEGVRLTGATGSGNSGAGIRVSAGSHLAFNDITIINNAGYGLASNTSAANTDWSIDGSTFDGNFDGLRIATGDSLNGLSITNSVFQNNQYGIEVYAATAGGTSLTNVTVSDTQFLNNVLKGAYFEKLDHAAFSNLTVSGNGTGVSSPAGFDINLKYGVYSHISFSSSNFTNNGNGSASGNGLTIKGRNDAPSYNSNPASLSNVSLSGVTISGSPIDLALGNNVSGVTLSSVVLNDGGTGLVNYITAPGTLNIGDTSFDAGLTAYILNESANTVDATGATFGAVTPSDNNVGDLYGVEDKVLDGVDQAGLGEVVLRNNNVYVAHSSEVPAQGSTGAIQRGIGFAANGNTVHVQAGTFSDDVNVNKSIDLQGAQSGVAAPGRSAVETVINSPDGHTELEITASDATVDGFTIQGNTNANLFGPGVYIVPGVSGTTFENNIVQNNIIGLDLENASATDQAKIEDNLFQNNTNPGSASGTDIYADQYTAGSGGVQDVLISGNTFTNTGFVEDSWGIGFSNEGTAAFNNVQVLNDTFSNAGRGMYFYGTSDLTINSSTVSGATHYAIGLFGAAYYANEVNNSDVTISQNTLDGNGTGIELEDGGPDAPALAGGELDIANNFLDSNTSDGILISSDALSNTATVLANINSIAGNGNAGLEDDSTALTVDASNNWWGSSDGPDTTLNTFKHPTTGDAVIGSDVIIAPWLADGIDSAPAVAGFQHAPASSSAPAAPSAPVLETADDSGSSHSDDITNVNTPHFTGTSSAAESGDTVTLYDTDGVTVLGTDTVGVDGSWTIQSSTLADGAHTVTAIITDGSGNQSNRSDSLTVDIDTHSPAPTITESGADTDQEGALVSLTGAVHDPAPSFGSPTFDWHVTDNNGQVISDGTSQNFSFTPDDNGSYTVTYTVTDAAGNVGSTQDIISISNVAPTATLATNVDPGTEGAAIDLTASATDPSSVDIVAGFTYNWTITKKHDGGPTTTYLTGSFGPSATADINFTPDDDGTYIVTVTATDKDGGVSTITGASTATFIVTNVAPTPTITGAPANSPAGVQINLGSTVTDPSSVDTTAGFTYLWSVTLNGNPYTTDLGATNTSSFSFTPVVAGSYVVSFKATDKDGGSTTTTAAINVTAVTPAITLSGSKTDGGNATPNDAEGSTFTLTLGALQDSDLIPGGDTINNYTILWGDASSPTVITGAQLNSLVSSGGTVQHVYEDGTTAESSTPNTNIQVDVTLTDGLGHQHLYAPATGGTLAIDVYNVAPSATLSGNASVNEGSSGFVEFISQSDPSPVDLAAGFTYSFSIVGVPSSTFGAGSNPSATVPAMYLSTPGTMTVQGTITDKDGGSSSYTFPITVNNVAPTVNAISTVTIGQNSPWSVGGSFTDPGADSPWLVFVNYNYNAISNNGIGSLVQSGSNKSFTLGTTYSSSGIYTVKVTVEDLNGTGPFTLSGTTTFSVDVNPTTFQVTNFSHNASGFDVTFDRAADLNVLNIYKGLTAEYGSADVTLVGQNSGTVTGSLVWNAATDTAQFIKTSGVLAPDTYTVTLRSASDAWQDTSNSLLDGLNDGTPGSGNYVNQFTITSDPDVVSLPYFSRGPGQTVNTPANMSNGIPVSISNGTNVTAVDFDISYNPALLNISSVNLASDLPGGWSMAVNNTVPGLLQMSVFGETALGVNAKQLIDVIANVPLNATYGASAAMNITNLVINGGAINGTAASAVEKVALIGDALGSGVYDPFDAYLISNVVVHNATGFDAYPLTDPVIVGNITGTGSLSGQDASDVAQASIGLPVALVPPLANGYVPPASPIGPGVDPLISIPTNVPATAGGIVTLPINIDDGSLLHSALITLGYDSSKLTLLSNATAGTLDPSWGVFANPANGEVAIFNPGNTPLSGGGDIANISFSVAANDTGTVPVPIASADLNANQLSSTTADGSILIEPLPAAGNFIVNDGNPQRSMVDYLTVVFNEPVTLAAGALTLNQFPPLGGPPVAQSFTLSNPSHDRMTYVLTVNSATGSVDDGSYDVVVNAAAVTDDAGAPMSADQSFGFYRYYGDFFGTGVVDFNSLVAVTQNFNKSDVQFGPNWYLDSTNSGTIGFKDLVAVVQKFNKSIAPTAGINAIPTATAGSPLTITATAAAGKPASTDDTLSYQWTVTDNNGEAFSLPNGGVTNVPSLTFTPGAAGPWSVKLTVTDTTIALSTSTATQAFTVNPAPPSGGGSQLGGHVIGLNAVAAAPASVTPLFSNQPITASWLQNGNDVLEKADGVLALS